MPRPVMEAPMHLSSLWGLTRSLLIYYNPWRVYQMRRFYRGLVSPGDLVFDVGAHVGSRARALRAAGARVVAFEPQPLFARFLAATLPRDIVLEQAALGAQEAEAEMVVSSRHPTVSSLRGSLAQEAAAMPGFEHVRWDRRARVQVTSLDAAIARHGRPVLVKIDVEGFEPEVLSGLSAPVALVSVEYLPSLPEVGLKSIIMLSALGHYEFNAVAGEDGRFLWPDWRSEAEIRAWLAALPPEGGSGDIYARLVEGTAERRIAAT